MPKAPSSHFAELPLLHPSNDFQAEGKERERPEYVPLRPSGNAMTWAVAMPASGYDGLTRMHMIDHFGRDPLAVEGEEDR